MNDDITIKAVLVKYKEGNWQYMRKDSEGNIIATGSRKGALMFTPAQARSFIAHMGKIGFPHQCVVEPVK